MVVIIGGRGIGKSFFFDVLCFCFVGVIVYGIEECEVNVEYLLIELDKINGEKMFFDICIDSYDYLYVL